MNKIDEKKFPKILLLTAERVGDTLFCTQAIRLLKLSLPEVEFDVLAFSKLAATIFDNNPDVDNVYAENNALKIRSIAKRYPLSINLMHEMLKFLNKMPEPFLTIGKPDESKHRVTQLLEFVSSILENPAKLETEEYALFPQEKHKEKIKQLLKEQGVDLERDILVGCQLGCHRTARRGWKIWNRKRHQHKKVWPIENYVDLAKRLTDTDPRIRFILIGSPAERYLAKMFLSLFPKAIDLIGKTSLHDIAALMDLLKVHVTHDTGNMHIACARGTPLVALFGPTPVSFTGPYPMQPQYTVIQRESIGDINVSEVYSHCIHNVIPA